MLLACCFREPKLKKDKKKQDKDTDEKVSILDVVNHFKSQNIDVTFTEQ